MFENEAVVRLVFFAFILCAVAMGEALFPKRRRQISRGLRWPRNLSLVLLSSLFVRFLVPISAAGAALFAAQHHYGLLNNLSLPFGVTVVISLLLLDLIIYGQHVVFHYVPFLWRLHKVHHSDQEIDVTTALRFHPVEIILSVLIKAGSVLLLGVPLTAVVIFEILLNGTAMFNHGNIRLPRAVDKILRLFMVTPDMHRVHHSVIFAETNRNFGFNIPWWDKLFGTYQAQPAKGHEKMDIGLNEYRDAKKTGLWALLTLPFKSGG